jgi:hypothetical protein
MLAWEMLLNNIHYLIIPYNLILDFHYDIRMPKRQEDQSYDSYLANRL